MRWAIGITTAPREPSTLVKCIKSTRKNGWEPSVFAEPGTDLTGLECALIMRDVRLGAWHNWREMGLQLLAAQPDADVILTIQDDTRLIERAKEFFESQGWPDNPDRVGFVSLYTPSHYQQRFHLLAADGRLLSDCPNEPRARRKQARYPGSRVVPTPKPPGCFPVATDSLWGACALAFPRASLEKIVRHKIAETWRGANGRQKGAEIRNVDTAIGKICNALGLKMWFWNPSLAQHIAVKSTLPGHGGCTGKRAAAYVATDPFRDCIPIARPGIAKPQAARLQQGGLWWVSNDDLDGIVADLCSRLPGDIRAVCGVPRSGLLAAYLAAKHLHLPMVPIESLMDPRVLPYRPAVSRKLRAQAGRVLLIDDSVSSGKTWDELERRIRVPHLKAAAIATPAGAHRVEHWGCLVGNPHLFHWNWTSVTHAGSMLFDLDGVIGEDWQGDWAGADATRYEQFLANARPLHLPRLPVMGIVTGREERFRAETELWLARHGVQYGSLIMNPGRRDHAEFKGEVYRRMHGALCFAESSDRQAAEIFRRTGRPVLSVETWRMYGAAELVRPRGLGSPGDRPQVETTEQPDAAVGPVRLHLTEDQAVIGAVPFPEGEPDDQAGAEERPAA